MFLDKKIPYYGKCNSICDIRKLEEEKTYVVRRYDSMGKVREDLFHTPNKYKNTLALRDEYYNDVSEFLEKNKIKYDNYKSMKNLVFKNMSDKKIVMLKRLAKIGIVLGISAVGISFYLAGIAMMLYIGTGILVLSSVGNVFLNDLSKGINIKKYIDKYEGLRADLIEYESGIGYEKRKNPTEYEKLNQETNDKIIDFSYKRVKSKVA